MDTGPAWGVAAELGHGWVGVEHFLLAVMRTESVAAQALRDCGATNESLAEALDRALRSDQDHPFEPLAAASRREPTPAAYRLMGRAEGFAASRGAEPGPEDLLLAVLWNPDSLSSGMLKEVAGGREAVKARLGELGVPVPAPDPPPDDTRPVGPKVYFPPEKLDVVLREVLPKIPDGGHFGWNLNHDRTKAYVTGPPDIDMGALVAEALER